MTNVRLLYVTTPSIEQARLIGATLVERRLIACANILPEMESIYHWHGHLERARECVLILKTTADKVEEVTLAVQELHPSEVPCVLEIEISSGGRSFIDWVVKEVSLNP